MEVSVRTKQWTRSRKLSYSIFMKKSGQTQMLRSIGVGKSKVVDRSRCSSPSNLHNLAGRLKIKIATRTIPAGKNKGRLEVFRVE